MYFAGHQDVSNDADVREPQSASEPPRDLRRLVVVSQAAIA